MFHKMRAVLVGFACLVASAAAQSGDCKTCTRFMTSLQENFDSEPAFTTVQDSFRATLCSALPDEFMVKTVSYAHMPVLHLPAVHSRSDVRGWHSMQ
jgi:hypothetical protein